METIATPIEIRLKNKLVEMPSGCIEFVGAKSSGGYGLIWDNSSKKLVRTHRVAWELANGPIPDGLCVLHRCDNRPCCNVEHLWLGTYADNAADAVTKGRNTRYNALKTHCPQDHPYNEENTYLNRGRRHCRACISAKQAHYRKPRQIAAAQVIGK